MAESKIQFKIKEHSLWARLARYFMKAENMAMVFGKTIHLSGVTKERFLKNSQWLQHELVHIEQYQKYGFAKFLYLYSLEWIKNGYTNNKFEIEARIKAGEE